MAGRLPTPQPQEEGLQSDQSEAGLRRPMPDWLENRQVPQSIKNSSSREESGMTGFQLTRRQLMLAGVATYALSSTPWAAYSEKPVRWIVGYPPGGATDTIARLLAQSMSSVIGQPIVIDNR